MSVKDDYPAITILADACRDKADDGVPFITGGGRSIMVRYDSDDRR